MPENLELFREHWNAVFAYAADMQVATDFLIDSCEQWNIIEAALIQLETDEETDKSEKTNSDLSAANENATSSSQPADDSVTTTSEDELFMKSIINALANECQHIIQEDQRKALLDRVAPGGTESHSLFREFVGDALKKTFQMIDVGEADKDNVKDNPLQNPLLARTKTKVTDKQDNLLNLVIEF